MLSSWQRVNIFGSFLTNKVCTFNSCPEGSKDVVLKAENSTEFAVLVITFYVFTKLIN